MANTSATGGYLLPTTGPLEGQALRRFLHDLIVGITGLDNTMVRPLWQPTPPVVPGEDTNWCAFGISIQTADANAYVVPINDTDGSALQRHEEIEIQTVFYGPNCQSNAAKLRDGFQISQNREALFLAGMGFASFGDILHSPELVNQKWLDRVDASFVLRRQLDKNYQILTFSGADGVIETETLTEEFSVRENP